MSQFILSSFGKSLKACSGRRDLQTLIAKTTTTVSSQWFPLLSLRRSGENGGQKGFSNNNVLFPTKNAKLHILKENKSINSRSTESQNRITDFISNLSPRQEAKLEQSIVESLGNCVLDPILNQDIRKLGWIHSINFQKPHSSRLLQNVNKKVEEDVAKACSKIKVTLFIPSLMHPNISKLKEDVSKVVKECLIDAVSQIGALDIKDGLSSHSIQMDVDVNVSAPSKPSPFIKNMEEREDVIKNLGPGLKHVTHFLTVYSAKGGVGKSTVAVNLAYELARMGGKVGILDADIYGPSLPTLVNPDDLVVRKSELGSGMVMPIEHRGVKMLSLGFVSPESGVPGSGAGGGAAVMRGPMAGRVVTQLLKGTDWGELDVLVIDMPPGTGDVQLTICQDLQLSGSVCVTTPSKLALADAEKGIEMFTSMGVPILAIAENMSYFDSDDGERHHPFGKSIRESIEKLQRKGLQVSKSNVFQFPLSSETNYANDCGLPLCISRPINASKELDSFEQLASSVASQLFLLQHGNVQSDVEGISEPVSIKIGDKEFDVTSLHMTVDNSKQLFRIRLFSNEGATELKLDGKVLRMWHPKLGTPMQDEETVAVTQTSGCGTNHNVEHRSQQSYFFPCKLDKKGLYGYSIEWADGATIIYSMHSLAAAAAYGTES